MKKLNFKVRKLNFNITIHLELKMLSHQTNITKKKRKKKQRRTTRSAIVLFDEIAMRKEPNMPTSANVMTNALNSHLTVR